MLESNRGPGVSIVIITLVMKAEFSSINQKQSLSSYPYLL